MTLPRASFPIAALLVLAACGDDDGDGDAYDCPDYCADLASCPDTAAIDCAQLCDQVASLEDASGCAEQWDDWVDCNGANPDEVCADTPQTCLTQGLALAACVQLYCDANPTDPDCAAVLDLF